MEILPATMKAVRLLGHGGFDQLELSTDVPVPLPRDDEVLIAVGAAGVNNTDINTRIGWYSRAVTEDTEAAATDSKAGAQDRAADSGWTGTALRFPRIQGADACGRIVAVGAGVATARLGERVLVEPVFQTPLSQDRYAAATYFGSECDGAFAEFARVPARHAHRIASPLSDAELASFPCSYSAAENMLSRLSLASGETVLITGASGGVGSAAVQLARRRGARVIAVADPLKARAVAALGAERVLGRKADLAAECGADSVDAVVDVVGGSGFAGLLDVLRRGGRYAVAGAIAGPIVGLDLRTLYLKDLRLFGCTVLDAGVFANLVGYIERGEIRPVVAGVHALEDIVAAQQRFLRKEHTGKIVLTP
jgi:NADPH:quinone reductase-like Zn-dependent oxidoreductase